MTRLARGYTLIELLVALSILALIFGIGFSGFRDYSRKQGLETVARQLRGDLATAKQKASSGIKSTHAACNGVNVQNGYGFNVGAASGIYRVYFQCSGGSVLQKTVTMPTGYTIASNPVGYFLIFKSLGQGTNLASGSNMVVTITQTSSGSTRTVTITSSGEIQ